MKIPNKIKVGGKTYTVEITNKLDHGNKKYSGEVDYLDLVIRICPSAKEKMETDFVHELLHAVHDFMGINPQEEEAIDRLANTLHMVIKDNPDVFGEPDVNAGSAPIDYFKSPKFVYVPDDSVKDDEGKFGLLFAEERKIYFGRNRGFVNHVNYYAWNIDVIERQLRSDLEQEEIK